MGGARDRGQPAGPVQHAHGGFHRAAAPGERRCCLCVATCFSASVPVRPAHVQPCNQVLVFRGGDGHEYLNDLHALDVDGMTWRDMKDELWCV